MTILGVVGSIVTQIMIGQQRFFQRMNEQTVVRRELRAASSLMPSELRALSSTTGDITAFDNMSISFRATIGSSVICDKPSSTTIGLAPPNMARMTLTSWITTPTVGDIVSVLRADSVGVKGDFWTEHTITAISLTTNACVGSALLDPSLDAGKDRWRLTVTPAVDDSVMAGSAVRVLRQTRYALAQQASGRWYLGRSELSNGGWGSAVPVSGPYQPPSAAGTGGISVAMYDTLGSQVSSIANVSKVARIDVVLRARGRSGSGSVGGASKAVEDTLAFRVALRNRR